MPPGLCPEGRNPLRSSYQRYWITDRDIFNGVALLTNVRTNFFNIPQKNQKLKIKSMQQLLVLIIIRASSPTMLFVIISLGVHLYLVKESI